MFTYMLDFILRPGGKLEQDNASLLKFKGNLTVTKGFDQVERASANHTHQ